jgi:hypothetical protein
MLSEPCYVVWAPSGLKSSRDVRSNLSQAVPGAREAPCRADATDCHSVSRNCPYRFGRQRWVRRRASVRYYVHLWGEVNYMEENKELSVEELDAVSGAAGVTIPVLDIRVAH